MRESILKRRPHPIVIAHEVAGADEEIEEIERAESRLCQLITINRFTQLALQQRREIGIGSATELLQLVDQLLMDVEDFSSQDAFSIRCRFSTGPDVFETPCQKVDEPRFETIVIALADTFGQR